MGSVFEVKLLNYSGYSNVSKAHTETYTVGVN